MAQERDTYLEIFEESDRYIDEELYVSSPFLLPPFVPDHAAGLTADW